MKYAFDADVLIYASVLGHPLGSRVENLLRRMGEEFVGSVFLLPEALTKPISKDWQHQTRTLSSLLSRLDLLDVTHAVATSAADLGAKYQLKAGDAVHLATAVSAGAGVFLTNNRKDFKSDEISELEIVYPEQLPAA